MSVLSPVPPVVPTPESIPEHASGSVEALARAMASAAEAWPGSLAPFHSLLMQAPVALVLLRGPDLVFELVNTRAEKFVGRGISLGLPLRVVLPEVAAQPRVMNMIEGVLRTGEPFVGDAFPVALDRHGDGQLDEALFDMLCQPLRDAEGQVDGVLMAVVEVTSQVRALQRAEVLEEGMARQARALDGWERLFAHAALGMASVDPETGLLDAVNAAYARMHGYDCPADLIGVPVRALMSAKSWEAFPAQLAITLDRGHHTYEQVRVQRNGVHFPVLVDAVALRGADGRVAYRAVVVQDLRERKAAEDRFAFMEHAGEVLSSSLECRPLLQRLTELAVPRLADGCAVDLLTEDGAVERVALSHRDPERGAIAREMGRRWPLGAGPEGDVAEVLRAGQPWFLPDLTEAQRDALARDAEHLSLLRAWGLRGLMVVPLRARGRVLGCVSFVVEDGGRRYSEADLALAMELARRASLAADHALLYAEAREAQARTERLQSVTAALSRAVTAEDVADVLVREGLQASGAVRGAVLMRDAVGRVRPLRLAGYGPVMQERLQMLQTVAATPMLARVEARRESLWFSSRAVIHAEHPEESSATESTGEGARAALPLMTESRVLGYLLLGWEATRNFTAAERTFLDALARQCAQALERAELYEALQAAHAQAQAAVRMRDEFLSVASHELKTPLTSLILQHGLIERALGPDTGSQVGLRLTTAMRQVQRLTALVDNLLDVSRLSLGNLSLEPTEVDLAQAARDAVDRLGEVFAQARCPVSVETREPLRGQWDALRLDQVLVNLLTNAAKYGAGRPVRVSTGRGERGEAWVEVRDEGIGIPADALPRLFGRFERAVSERNYGGLGLGLYISRQIVEALGGRIEVASLPGQGATFTVHLPCAPPPGA
ncbi:GAF domain-containing protein [Myxococcaceae bacterium JPH2]|nr:GAF domain-containing protein [Myxococcaceae bacterium JPH2]